MSTALSDECTQLLEVLSLEDDLPSEREAEVRAHLDTCSACRAARAEQDRLRALLRQADLAGALPQEPNAAMRAALLRRCSDSLRTQPAAAAPVPRSRRALFFSFVSAAALAAALLLVSRPQPAPELPSRLTQEPAPERVVPLPPPRTRERAKPVPSAAPRATEKKWARVPSARRRSRRDRRAPAYRTPFRLATRPAAPRRPAPAASRPVERVVIVAEGSSNPEPVLHQTIRITAAGNPEQGGSASVVVTSDQEVLP